MVRPVTLLGSYVIDGVTLPIIDLYLRDGKLWVIAKATTSNEPIRVRDGAGFLIRGYDDRLVLTGHYRGMDRIAVPSPAGDPATMTIIQPVHLIQDN